MFEKFTRTARVARESKWPFYPTQIFALSIGPNKKGVWNLEDVENIYMPFKKPLELFLYSPRDTTVENPFGNPASTTN